jgi:hypothetical protein
MNQRKKIITTVFFFLLLLCGLYVDFPKLFFIKYSNTQQFKVINWTSSALFPNPERISVEESLINPIFNIDIKFHYKKDGDLHPNLFQTSNYNEGVRLEFSGDNAAIIYGCKNLCPTNGYNVVDLTKYLNFSSENYINLFISQGKFIKIKVNSSPEIVISKPPPIIKYDNILVGSGFDRTRGFNGSIEQFHLKLNSGRAFFFIQVIYYLLLIFFYMALIFYLKKIPTK